MAYEQRAQDKRGRIDYIQVTDKKVIFAQTFEDYATEIKRYDKN